MYIKNVVIQWYYFFFFFWVKRQIMNGQFEKPQKQFVYESPIEKFYYDCFVVLIEKPLEKMDWKLRQ